MTGKLTITLKSDLCAGSGESTGLSVDKDLCISERGLPYIPARRLKGCLRATAEALRQYGCAEASPENICALFGSGDGDAGCLRLCDAKLSGADAMEAWLSSDDVPKEIKTDAAPLNVAKLFTYVRGQTRLEDGVAVDNSLRYTRVMDRYNALDRAKETELVAEASIFSNSEDLKKLFQYCCKATRHIGSMRNRGLGNVSMSWSEETSATGRTVEPVWTDDAHSAERVQISYTVSLDAPVTLPGCAEQSLEIPARSVIGCMASAYPDANRGDDEFRKLFLDGSVRWSSLTPMIDGKRSTPTPLMLVHLKNEGSYLNLYSAQGGAEGKKQKTLGSTYAVQSENGFELASVSSHTRYHHSHTEDGGLYMQDSLDAGMLYGGVVSAPTALAEAVCELLKAATLAFGRSRGAQYAACSIVSIAVAPEQNDTIAPAAGESVYAVLQSDLILTKGGVYDISPEAVRAALAEKLGLEGKSPDSKKDYCLYHTIGGYQQMWQMQKPQIPAVRGGSVYCFKASGGKPPRMIQLGELVQEGFGVVRVFTQEEMNGLTQVKKKPVDAKCAETDNAQVQALISALVTASSKRVALEKADAYYRKCGAKLEHGIVGRLRLMLSEAESYEDFIARIKSIKSSDENSEKEAGKGKIALAWIQGLFGVGPFSLETLFGSAKILETLQNDADASGQLKEDWKTPINVLLHTAYYDTEGAN